MILTIKNINSDKIVNGDVVAVIVIIIILKVKIIGFDNALVIAISESKLHVPILTSEVDIVGYDMRDGAVCYIKKKLLFDNYKSRFCPNFVRFCCIN